jgi:hypothetical protein
LIADEVGRGHALLAFELHLEQLQRASLATTGNQGTAFNQKFSGRHGALDGLRRPDMEIFSAEAGVRSRPGLKAAQAVQDFLSCVLKINLAILFL